MHTILPLSPLELVIASLVIGLIPAFIARRKGHDFWVYWIIGSVLFGFTLAYTVFMAKAGERDARGTALKSTALGVVIFAIWLAVGSHISPPLSL